MKPAGGLKNASESPDIFCQQLFLAEEIDSRGKPPSFFWWQAFKVTTISRHSKFVFVLCFWRTFSSIFYFRLQLFASQLQKETCAWIAKNVSIEHRSQHAIRLLAALQSRLGGSRRWRSSQRLHWQSQTNLCTLLWISANLRQATVRFLRTPRSSGEKEKQKRRKKKS